MDADSIPRSIILILILILAGGFFAGTETAYASCSRVRLMSWADDGRKSARRALRILEKFDKAIITLLIGNNAVHVVATSLATVLFVRLIKNSAAGSLAATVVMTLLVFIFSETVPKNIAKANCDEFACAVSVPLSFLMLILTPVAWLFMGLSFVLKKILRKADDGPAMTEDDFTSMIESIEDEGVLEADESELIQSAVEFTDRTVSEILTPRIRISGLDIHDADEVNFRKIIDEKFSRLPVYDHDMDHILGILNCKQYLQHKLSAPAEYPSVRELMSEPYFIGQDMGLHALVDEMRRRKNHIAIVRDAWGGTEGMVTLDDLLEELVGEIWDEDEQKIEAPAGGEVRA